MFNIWWYSTSTKYRLSYRYVQVWTCLRKIFIFRYGYHHRLRRAIHKSVLGVFSRPTVLQYHTRSTVVYQVLALRTPEWVQSTSTPVLRTLVLIYIYIYGYAYILPLDLRQEDQILRWHAGAQRPARWVISRIDMICAITRASFRAVHSRIQTTRYIHSTISTMGVEKVRLDNQPCMERTLLRRDCTMPMTFAEQAVSHLALHYIEQEVIKAGDGVTFPAKGDSLTMHYV